MTPRRANLWVFALILALALPFSPSTGAQAQGNSRTFPQTGKTVGGRFLQYWDGHGGLAQQGYPSSEEIQETSDTDGKVYTVQYFERAVFELHPENKAPNDVLLQLLGGFLNKQKYPGGAPGEVPNNEPGSRLFTETSHRLGGVFQQYWTGHGGLAQQGFPISNEFMEKSDLDGKTYKVQYFERAVFELHPENPPPFNVLLSQLGTFRHKAKYGALVKQLSGTGNKNTASFPLKAGLTVFQSVRTGPGYFYIDVADSTGNKFGTIASTSDSADVSAGGNVPADGMYMLLVQADGPWTVNIWQPKATYSPPPARQSFKGHGWQATPLISLKSGSTAFHSASANNKEEFRINLKDQRGEAVASIADARGPADVSTTLQVPADGVYMIEVQSDGDWTVDVRQ